MRSATRDLTVSALRHAAARVPLLSLSLSLSLSSWAERKEMRV